MQQSKIVQYLKSLDKRQRRKFRLFVQSPYFNQHQNTIQLLALLEAGLNKPDKGLDKAFLIKKLAAQQVNPAIKFYHAVSFLLRLFYRFQAIENFEQQDFDAQLHLLEATQRGQQDKLFELTTQKLKTNFQQSYKADADFYYSHYRFYSIQANNQQKEKKNTLYPALQAASDYLDIFFVIEKLRLCCNMLAETAVVSKEYDLSLLEEVLELIHTQKKYQDYPAIQLYTAILKMLQESDNSATYQEVRQLMKEHLNIFSKEEALDISNHAQNFCVRQINLGRQSYLEELHQLYQQSLDNQLLFINEQFNEWVYLNIVAVSCRLSKYEWTKAFLEKYQAYLPENARSNAYNYNLAFYNHHKGAYSKAMELLQNVEFTDIFYQWNARILEIKILFIQVEWERLEYVLESFRVFLLRSKEVGIYRKKSAINLIRWAKKVVLLKEKEGILNAKTYKAELQQLKELIQLQENVLNKKWLLMQCVV